MKIFNIDGDVVDQHSKKIGFRQVKLVMNEGTWLEPIKFPKTRSVAPITLEINGKRIFAKGANWVPPEIFPGTITKERYEELLNRVIDANFNIVRQWGGGIVNKESFYDLCDEKGILVWQDFPLACNNYPDDPVYIRVLEQEAISIINRLRQHPSLAMWCGGNELFNNWSGMTDQSIALRLLNKLCLELDPNTPFIATSPVFGMGHGHYLFYDHDTDTEVFDLMINAGKTAYSEFGVSAPSSEKVLKTFIPPDDLWPPSAETAWSDHHAFHSWIPEAWLMLNTLERYFGPTDNLDQLIERGQFLQAEGLRFIYEEARRQKPYCSMALNWCFNDVWPSAANNSIIEYPNEPKPGFYAVAQACRPAFVSAQLTKFQWEETEVFSAGIWLLCDVYKSLGAGVAVVHLEQGERREEICRWHFEHDEPNRNLVGPVARTTLQGWKPGRIKLNVKIEGSPELDSEYTFLYKLKKKERFPILNF
jgi:beta-mannosidase